MIRQMTFEEFRYLVMAGLDDTLNKQITGAISTLGGKWKLQILYALLSSEHLRFNELKKRLPGITPRQLIADLRVLKADDFIDKRPSVDKPDQMEYMLLGKGRDLVYLFYDYMNWGFSYLKISETD